MKRILFFKFGAMGDVLMTTPLVRQTRQAFPDTEIDYCVADAFATVLRDNPHLNRLLTFDPKIFTSFKPMGFLKLVSRIRTRCYDCVFVLDKHPIFALTAFLTAIEDRIGFVRDAASKFFLTRCVPFGGLRHDVHSNLDLLGVLTAVDYADTRMEFIPGRCRIEKFQLTRPYVACANSGGENVRETGRIRRLPDEKFLDLLRDLAAQQTVVLLGNRGDREYYDSLTLPKSVVNLAGETSILECVEIIAHAEKFFTTDCGLMHLAATTATPIFAFFGPTHPRRKAPLRENVDWVWTDEKIYDAEYDRRGRTPHGVYFSSLDFRRLLEEGTPDLLDVNSAGEVALNRMPTP
jgi:ADP-heptose:LPS heptosyltransferase